MRRITVASITATLVIGLLTVWLCALVPSPDECPVNRIAGEQVEEGMTLAEVEAILGGPDGWYATEDVTPGGGCGNWGGACGKKVWVEGRRVRARQSWVGNMVVVDIILDESGRVKYKRVEEMFPAKPTFIERMGIALGF